MNGFNMIVKNSSILQSVFIEMKSIEMFFFKSEFFVWQNAIDVVDL